MKPDVAAAQKVYSALADTLDELAKNRDISPADLLAALSFLINYTIAENWENPQPVCTQFCSMLQDGLARLLAERGRVPHAHPTAH
jgi:hypothetical protein